MGQLEQTVGQTQFVHDLQNRGVKGVSAKVAVKVHVRFEQQHIDTLACQHEGQDSARWSSSHDDARRLLHITYLMGLDGSLGFLRKEWFVAHRYGPTFTLATRRFFMLLI